MAAAVRSEQSRVAALQSRWGKEAFRGGARVRGWLDCLAAGAVWYKRTARFPSQGPWWFWGGFVDLAFQKPAVLLAEWQ